MGQAWRNARRDCALVLLLLLIGVCVKGWIVARSVVIARDGITFIHIAQRLEQQPWTDVLTETHQHPLYPIHVLLASKFFKFADVLNERALWEYSAQWANAFFGIALAVPLFFLGKESFDRRVGFWATLLFLVLPVPARITSDALSEGLYLFWAISSLLMAAKGLRRPRLRWFLLSGAFAGLAYLTRPEGVVIVAAISMMVFLSVLFRGLGNFGSGNSLFGHFPRLTFSWKTAVASLMALYVGAATAAMPYFLCAGRISGKPSVTKVLEARINDTHSTGGGVLLAARISDGEGNVKQTSLRAWNALYQVLDEIIRASLYVVWVPAILATTWFYPRWRQEPALMMLSVLSVVYVLVLWRLALSVNYVSQRHTVLIVVSGCVLSMAAIFSWCDRWSLRGSGNEQCKLGRRTGRINWSRSTIVQVLLPIVLLLALARSLQPLHGHREGHRHAGEWLAENTYSEDLILDAYGWASYYGKRLPLFHEKPLAGGLPPRRFVIADMHDAEESMERVKAEQVNDRLPVPYYQWPESGEAEVIVYGPAAVTHKDSNGP